MRMFWRFLPFIVAAAGLVLLPVMGGLFIFTFGAAGVPLLFMLLAFYTWVASAFLRYRHGRQDELLHLLTAAAESGAPLAPTLRAYLVDRPHGGTRERWVALLLFFVLPGYYWVWHRQNSYDRKVARVARMLELGVPLDVALRTVPGVVPPETVLAAAVGQSTGRLADSLRGSTWSRLSTVWLEITPRLLYPTMLLLVMLGIFTFWGRFLLPKYQVILRHFNVKLPATTAWMVQLGDAVEEYPWVIVLVFVAVLATASLLYYSSTLRWYCPGIGRLYRGTTRGRVLKALGILLEGGKTVPEALGIMSASGYFSGTVRRRLERARTVAERGETLPDTLRRAGLLPRPMTMLVGAAERARNLPWALAELGDHLMNRAGRLAQRASMTLAPAAVVVLGAIAGAGIVGMFMPLVHMLWQVSG
jgi:type II secretory pathway component PulF